jgi:hypothetical protein
VFIDKRKLSGVFVPFFVTPASSGGVGVTFADDAGVSAATGEEIQISSYLH